MSNQSWKQFGGISNVDDFKVVNATTVIADQFISRSTRPTLFSIVEIFQTSADISAGQNFFAGNSIYADHNLVINKDIYSNNKIFFGNNELQNTTSVDNSPGNVMPEYPENTTHAYFYGNSNNIGVNTLVPKTVFNITGTVDSVTDILTVESTNEYVRNIIAQNNKTLWK